jgi:hypothetical protein
VRQQPCGIIDETQRAVGVDRNVIPRRHLAPVRRLARIPVRRDVGVGAGEDDERLTGVARQFVMRVGPRQVPL